MAQDLTNIKSGSTVFVWGDSILSKVIRWYQGWDTKVKDTPTHVEVYFGSGKNECVSAEMRGVQAVDLKRHFGKNKRVEVYSYKKLTVEQLQKMKSFAYGRVDVTFYDFLGLVSFLGNLIGKKIPHWKWANFCSEIRADIYNWVKVKTTEKKIPSSEQHPALQWLYCKEHTDDWNLDFKYEK